MSPEFAASVEKFALHLASFEFGEEDVTLTPTDKHVLSGVVHGFIQRLTVVAYRYGAVKGRLDAQCFALACMKNRVMFKRMSRLLEADKMARMADRQPGLLQSLGHSTQSSSQCAEPVVEPR